MFPRTVNAASGAMKRWKDVLGTNKDPQVEIYEKLKEPDFATLTKQYGLDAVAEYVKEMERRKMGGKNA